MLFLLLTGRALAATHYVDINGSNATPPYTNWATAAKNIQDAVDAAAAGDEVAVTNGGYAAGVIVDKPLNLRSVNGPQFTFISGGGSDCCAYLTNGAELFGFTLQYGQVGVCCDSSNEVVSNCVITHNGGGDGAGGGAAGGTLNNCTLTDNWCTDVDNIDLPGASAVGGGAIGCTLNNCTLSGNWVSAQASWWSRDAEAYGGAAYQCTLNNCVLSGNSAFAAALLIPSNSGGGRLALAYGGGTYQCTVNNCVITDNSVRASIANNFIASADARAYGSGASDCTLQNCTLCSNSTGTTNKLGTPSGNNGGSVYNGSYMNCIFFRNTYDYPFSLEECPPSNGNNWCGDPMFVNTNGWSNLRLQSNSPCINAGDNAFAPTGPDVDGNPRIVGATVDMGAYEYQSLSLINFGVVSNQAGFNITGQSNQVVIVETSTDLTNWSPLATNTLSGHPFPFSDSAPASLPRRLYRVKAQ